MIEWALPWYERFDFQSFEKSDGGGGGLSLSGVCDADADAEAEAVPVLVDRSDRVLWWLTSVLVVLLLVSLV